jgi:hypothetical protein
MESQTWNPILKPQGSFKPNLAWRVRLGTLFWNHRKVLSQSWYGRSDCNPILKQQKSFKPNLAWKGRLGTLFWSHRAVLSQSWYGRSDLAPYAETTSKSDLLYQGLHKTALWFQNRVPILTFHINFGLNLLCGFRIGFQVWPSIPTLA